ncbi:NnrU family protein [Rhodopseudomonas sp. HC1]|uniref:NnrU family protein n=1 Tax=Rhodopseudomonas infernalis TaxID=2897386 RepID=UPI001EE885DA|nr:NnrU family protein [Rhodopseudomonas infernalis]MCG6205178.1 NnrU family protein [Rhodopseudomonas infernalis]
MTGWTEFIAAFAVFLLSHALPARPVVRAKLVGALGEGIFLAAYSTQSLIVLTWLIIAAGRAPFVELWAFERLQMWAPNLALPLACQLAAFGVGAANPLSFGGDLRKHFDPDHPGIVGLVRHPLLWAIGLWAAAHAVPNGDLAHVVLFGFFALIALAGMAIIDRRKRRQLGAETWTRLAARTSFWPFVALIKGRFRPDLRRISLLRFGIGLAAWLTLLLLHPYVIGVSPLP